MTMSVTLPAATMLHMIFGDCPNLPISSVTEPFCRDCHRARLSADGKLYTCLFASLGWDVLGAVRAGADAAGLENFLARIWQGRLDRYSDERAEVIAAGESRAKVEMSYIGG